MILLTLVGNGVLRAADLYVADVTSGAILRIAPGGAQTTFSSVGVPRGLAFDKAGNLYVADDGVAQSIIKITPSGVKSTFASGLTTPRGIAIDSADNLYVCDIGSNSILKFTPAGARSTFAGGLNRPADIAFDKAGNLFESDRTSGSILKFTASGVPSTFASGLNLPAGLAFDSAGSLFEVDQGTSSVLKFAPDGTRQTFALLDSSDVPVRVAVDAADNVYLSDLLGTGGAMIYKYTPAGMRSSFATENDTVGFLAFGPIPGQLLNISTRLRVLSGENVLIGGFIITGTAPKKVIIRGLGPSLGSVSGALPDPTLELHQGNNTIATNDNWKEHQADVEATTIPPKNDLESAIVATLTPGAYTAILSGKAQATGIGLVEAYDLDQTVNSKLANISTRGFVDTGDNVLIGGFIVGNGSSKVIVRALGPSLASSGLGGTLQNPTLELHNGDGSLLTANDNWKDSQRTEIEATTIPPSDDRESAIVATLPAGNYTAIVRGKDNTTGVGLVELYNLP